MATTDTGFRKIQTDAIASVTTGTAIQLQGRFNASVQGTFDGTVKLQRSYDNSTWETVSKDSAGNEAAFTAPCSLVVEEVESGVWYRWNVTARNSGTFNTRLSQ